MKAMVASLTAVFNSTSTLNSRTKRSASGSSANATGIMGFCMPPLQRAERRYAFVVDGVARTDDKADSDRPDFND
jgi:hypothetical protein